MPCGLLFFFTWILTFDLRSTWSVEHSAPLIALSDTKVLHIRLSADNVINLVPVLGSWMHPCGLVVVFELEKGVGDGELVL